MAAFNLEHFTLRLIVETLFYDEEYGVVGTLSLIDTAARQERYVASYVAEEGRFVIEEAIDWEEDEPEEADDIGYVLAVDTSEYGTYDTPEEAAAALLTLAREAALHPSVTLLFEDE